jgi:Domain of unknown function (DUF1840)
MLITFRSKVGDITMFGEVGKKMLVLMGQSGVVPGALMAADLPAAIVRLRAGATGEPAPLPESSPKGSRDDKEPPIALATRAKPLIDMLERAAKAGADVIWE